MESNNNENVNKNGNGKNNNKKYIKFHYCGEHREGEDIVYHYVSDKIFKLDYYSPSMYDLELWPGDKYYKYTKNKIIKISSIELPEYIYTLEDLKWHA